MMVYQVVYLLPLLGGAGTSAALVCTSVSAAGGRLVMSTMLDHLDQRLIAATTFASQAAALSLMVAMPGSAAALYLGSIIFGLGMGNVVLAVADHSAGISRDRLVWCSDCLRRWGRLVIRSVRRCSASCTTFRGAIGLPWRSALDCRWRPRR